MGRIYEYRCEHCGHEKTYRVGCGFLGFEDYRSKMNTEEKKLKKEIFDEKYGEHLKKVIESDETHFVFSCNEELYQCGKCKRIFVLPSREIEHSKLRNYTAKIVFDEFCPECRNDFPIDKISGKNIIYCPKCKNGVAQLTCLGNWD